MNATTAPRRDLRTHAEQAARADNPSLTTIAVYGLAELFRRDPEAALAIADASCRLAQRRDHERT